MKFVYFDPNNNGRVIQWIDTDAASYNLPDESLLQACSEADWRLQHSGEMMVSGGKVVPFTPPALSPSVALKRMKDSAFVSIDQFHSGTVQRLVGSPTQVEKDTWSLKLETASAIANKTPIGAAGQAFLASAGMTTDAAKAAWATSVLAKSTAYAQVVGLAEKLRDTARTAVKAATDEVSLKAALDAQRAAADAAVANLLKGT